MNVKASTLYYSSNNFVKNIVYFTEGLDYFLEKQNVEIIVKVQISAPLW
jgi:hypothetical protein